MRCACLRIEFLWQGQTESLELEYFSGQTKQHQAKQQARETLTLNDSECAECNARRVWGAPCALCEK